MIEAIEVRQRNKGSIVYSDHLHFITADAKGIKVIKRTQLEAQFNPETFVSAYVKCVKTCFIFFATL
jgi:hypothetical protein